MEVCIDKPLKVGLGSNLDMTNICYCCGCLRHMPFFLNQLKDQSPSGPNIRVEIHFAALGKQFQFTQKGNCTSRKSRKMLVRLS